MNQDELLKRIKQSAAAIQRRLPPKPEPKELKSSAPINHWRAPREEPLPGKFKHGSNGYTNYKCRCDACRAGNVELVNQQRLRRKELMDRGEVMPEHGRLSTYWNYMCRCDVCRAALAKRARDLRQRRLQRDNG